MNEREERESWANASCERQAAERKAHPITDEDIKEAAKARLMARDSTLANLICRLAEVFSQDGLNQCYDIINLARNAAEQVRLADETHDEILRVYLLQEEEAKDAE